MRFIYKAYDVKKKISFIHLCEVKEFTFYVISNLNL